jgi:uncharacterized MAPEG superfamily protein
MRLPRRGAEVSLDAPVGAPGHGSSSWTSVALHGADVVLVALAAIVAIVAGAPAVGCAIGAGVWILQRIVAVLDRRWAEGMRDPQRQVTVNLFERFGRIWLLAGGIVVAAVVGSRSDGLAAAVIVFAAYTFVFVIKLFSGPPPARSM